MAGIIDNTNLQTPTTISEAQNQVGALDAARQTLRSDQQANIRDLFSYDKTLADRYSNPDSNMYILNAADREKAVSGYFGAGKGQVTNLFDIMESVRGAQEKLNSLIDSMKKSSGGSGGSSSLSLSDFNDFLTGNGQDQETVPQPPKSVLDQFNKNPSKYSIYYNKEDDGTYYYTVAPKGKPGAAWLKEWSPELSQAKPDKSQLMQDYFGIDKKTLAQLNAISTINPKLANSLLGSMISSNVKNQATGKTTDDAINDIKSGFTNLDDAQSYIDENRQALVSKGLDVAKIEREIQTYYSSKTTKKKFGSGSSSFNSDTSSSGGSGGAGGFFK